MMNLFDTSPIFLLKPKSLRPLQHLQCYFCSQKNLRGDLFQKAHSLQQKEHQFINDNNKKSL
ncbi:hypothetical protein BpHYR1_012089 [Brachionus plicatilis]|uniref:Uncharacterized protein n=1 Tax=Brachionus plicatilis TaxID=10195 RepID=A0A3M7SS35_BRAPC|nr:hypothetical protein BpHYR1_012089 [Brachionus plicatilis]